jgi:hypothetical protein
MERIKRMRKINCFLILFFLAILSACNTYHQNKTDQRLFHLIDRKQFVPGYQAVIELRGTAANDKKISLTALIKSGEIETKDGVEVIAISTEGTLNIGDQSIKIPSSVLYNANSHEIVGDMKFDGKSIDTSVLLNNPQMPKTVRVGDSGSFLIEYEKGEFGRTSWRLIPANYGFADLELTMVFKVKNDSFKNIFVVTIDESGRPYHLKISGYLNNSSALSASGSYKYLE